MKRRTFIGCCYGLLAGCATARKEVSRRMADEMPYTRISACGLNCPECDLYRLPTDKSVQDTMIPYFRSKSWLAEGEGIEAVIAKGMYCKGCNVDKDVFWSSGACEIVVCCKDTRKLSNCSACSKFPCQKSMDFSNKGGKYHDAFDYLMACKDRRDALPTNP